MSLSMFLVHQLFESAMRNENTLKRILTLCIHMHNTKDVAFLGWTSFQHVSLGDLYSNRIRNRNHEGHISQTAGERVVLNSILHTKQPSRAVDVPRCGVVPLQVEYPSLSITPYLTAMRCSVSCRAGSARTSCHWSRRYWTGCSCWSPSSCWTYLTF